MATVTFSSVNCNYKAHAYFTLAEDPYPNGFYVYSSSGRTITDIDTSKKITIYASEVTFNSSNYGFPVYIYVNGVKYSDYLQSTYVTITPSDGMTIHLVPTETEEPETETGYVYVENEEGVKGYAYTYVLSGDDYSGSTELSPKTLFGDVDTNIKITSFSYTDSSKYTSPVRFTEYTDSSRTTVKTYWDWPTEDTKILVKSSSRYFGFKATLKTYTLTYEPNGTGVSGMPSDQTVSYGTYITVSNTTPTRSGYKFLGWSEDASAEVPDVYGGAGYVVYADRVLYAIWEKNAIEKFYWNGSDTADAALIATGLPVRNITAEMWNSLLAKISELASACGTSFSYTAVSSGVAITAATFNAARTGLSSIKTTMGTSTTLPSSQSSGNIIYATLFNGSTSIKGALNDMIEIYNSEYR